jgi:hypothetical protein
MNTRDEPVTAPSDDYLNVFCCREGECWRVHAERDLLPAVLLACFDRHGEAFPAFLDFHDLETFMATRDLPFEKRVAKTGGVELTAHGRAATALAQWLATSFASGVRGDEPGTTSARRNS